MCDGTRRRRTRDEVRRAWYARYRQLRFALHFGFIDRACFQRQLARA